MNLKVAALVLSLMVTSLSASDGYSSGSNEGSAHKTFVTHDCYSMKVKPRRILFACGDGNFYVTRLKWASWRKRRAVGHGKFHQNDCDPSCAEGEFHTRKGRLVLRGRMYCESKDKYSYARARIRYRKPLVGRKRVRFKLFCPL
jgi:hypothetical protein